MTRNSGQLDWQPTVSLEQGLAPTIDSFRNLLELCRRLRDVTIQRICCIGAGYVGGPTMAVIADRCPQVASAGGGYQPGAH